MVTAQVKSDKNLAGWIQGHEVRLFLLLAVSIACGSRSHLSTPQSYLHWTGRGYGQRKPHLVAKAVASECVVGLATSNPELERVLSPYPTSIPDSRAGRNRTASEDALAKTLIDDHVRSVNKFVPLFPADRDSIVVAKYDYRFEFYFDGKLQNYELKFRRKDLERPSQRALQWFTGAGCKALHSLAMELIQRLRKTEEEGMSKTLEKYMDGLEIAYNPEEGDDSDEDDEEEE